MSKKISIRCPSCMVRLKAPMQLIGETRSCPGCGTAFVVRDQSMEETKSDRIFPEDSAAIIVAEDDSQILTGDWGLRGNAHR